MTRRDSFDPIFRTSVLLLFSVFVSPSLLHAESGEYVRGYVSSYFKYQKAGVPAAARSFSPQGLLTLESSACLSAEEQSAVESDLKGSAGIQRIEWLNTSPCPSDKEEQERLVVKPLPVKEAFLRPLADPRSPRFSIKYQYYNSPRKDFNAGAVSAGDKFSLLRFGKDEEGGAQLSVDGGIFSLFDLDTDSNDLVNTDFVLGFPLAYARGPFSGQLRLYHQSSHLGDEFLLDNPDIERINYTFEELELLGALSSHYARIYGGGAALFNSEPDLDPLRAQGGIEFRIPNVIGPFGLVFASDLQARQELNWNLDQSYIAGISLTSGSEEGKHELRLIGEYYDGSSPNGQFFRSDVHYYGGGMQFEF